MKLLYTYRGTCQIKKPGFFHDFQFVAQRRWILWGIAYVTSTTELWRLLFLSNLFHFESKWHQSWKMNVDLQQTCLLKKLCHLSEIPYRNAPPIRFSERSSMVVDGADFQRNFYHLALKYHLTFMANLWEINWKNTNCLSLKNSVYKIVCRTYKAG